MPRNTVERRVTLWSPDGHSHAALVRESASELVLVIYTGAQEAGDHMVLDDRQLEALGIELKPIQSSG